MSQPFVILSSGITWVLVYRTEKYKRLKAEVEKQSKKRRWLVDVKVTPQWLFFFGLFHEWSAACLVLVEKKKETITESAGRQQKKKIGKKLTGKDQSCVQVKSLRNTPVFLDK